MLRLPDYAVFPVHKIPIEKEETGTRSATQIILMVTKLLACYLQEKNVNIKSVRYSELRLSSGIVALRGQIEDAAWPPVDFRCYAVCVFALGGKVSQIHPSFKHK